MSLDLFREECLGERIDAGHSRSALASLRELGILQTAGARAAASHASADIVKSLLRKASEANDSEVALETLRVAMCACDADTFADTAPSLRDAICKAMSNATWHKGQEGMSPNIVIGLFDAAADFIERAAADRRTRQALRSAKSSESKGGGSAKGSNLFILLIECAEKALGDAHGFGLKERAADILEKLAAAMQSYPGGFRGSSVRLGRLFLRGIDAQYAPTRAQAARCVALLPLAIGSASGASGFSNSWGAMMQTAIHVSSAMISSIASYDSTPAFGGSQFPPLADMLSWIDQASGGGPWTSTAAKLDGALRCIEAGLLVCAPKYAVNVPVDDILDVAKSAIFSNADDAYDPTGTIVDAGGFAQEKSQPADRHQVILLGSARSACVRILSALATALGRRMLRRSSVLVDIITHALKMHKKWPCAGTDIERAIHDLIQSCVHCLGASFTLLLTEEKNRFGRICCIPSSTPMAQVVVPAALRGQ